MCDVEVPSEIALGQLVRDVVMPHFNGKFDVRAHFRWRLGGKPRELMPDWFEISIVTTMTPGNPNIGLVQLRVEGSLLYCRFEEA
jgi:hypothetical protein